MNWYSVFYWVTVADGVKHFFDTASNIFTWFAVLSFIAFAATCIGKATCISNNNVQTDEEEQKDADVRSWVKFQKPVKGFMYTTMVLTIMLWVGYVFTPSKKDAMIIIAGGTVGNFLTKDTAAKQVPSEVFTLLRDKIRAEIRETNLNSKTVTDTLVNKSKEELIEMIQNKK